MLKAPRPPSTRSIPRHEQLAPRFRRPACCRGRLESPSCQHTADSVTVPQMGSDSAWSGMLKQRGWRGSSASGATGCSILACAIRGVRPARRRGRGVSDRRTACPRAGLHPACRAGGASKGALGSWPRRRGRHGADAGAFRPGEAARVDTQAAPRDYRDCQGASGLKAVNGAFGACTRHVPIPPAYLRSFPRTHPLIVFAEPMPGAIALGAGRTSASVSSRRRCEAVHRRQLAAPSGLQSTVRLAPWADSTDIGRRAALKED
jgi:hypothetical protein